MAAVCFQYLIQARSEFVAHGPDQLRGQGVPLLLYGLLEGLNIRLKDTASLVLQYAQDAQVQ